MPEPKPCAKCGRTHAPDASCDDTEKYEEREKRVEQFISQIVEKIRERDMKTAVEIKKKALREGIKKTELIPVSQYGDIINAVADSLFMFFYGKDLESVLIARDEFLVHDYAGKNILEQKTIEYFKGNFSKFCNGECIEEMVRITKTLFPGEHEIPSTIKEFARSVILEKMQLIVETKDRKYFWEIFEINEFFLSGDITELFEEPKFIENAETFLALAVWTYDMELTIKAISFFAGYPGLKELLEGKTIMHLARVRSKKESLNDEDLF